MVEKLKIGPKLTTPFQPEPLKPPIPENTIKEWEKKATEHSELAVKGQVELRTLSDQLSLVGKPMSGPFKFLKAFTEALQEPIPPSPEDVERFQVPGDIRERVLAAEFAVERDDFFSRLYGQVPFVISGNTSINPDEILSLLKPPSDMTPVELEGVQDIISGMFEALTGDEPFPELASEAEPVDLPELTPPTDITAPPNTISTLTISAIIKSLTAPVVPPSIMSEEEWKEFMVVSGQISDKADLESLEFMKQEADRIVREWQERNNMLESFRVGIAEMPDYRITDWLKEMVVTPGLGLLEAANFYFEHVSMPIAGAVYGGYFPDLDAKFQEYRQSESTWQALGHAWEDWDPGDGEGAAEWILKYMLMEGLVDPLTYVGWGIFTRLTKPLGIVGRGVGALEKGAARVFELPFDMLRASPDALAGLAQRLAGRPVTGFPKTIGQRATIAMHMTSRYVDKYMTQRFGKALYQLTMDNWRAGATTAIKYTLKNPMAQNDIALAGKQFLMHAPVSEKEVVQWADRLGTTLLPDQITRQTMDSADIVFESFFSQVGGNKKLMTNRESAVQLTKLLHGPGTEESIVIAGKILQQRARHIIATGHSFGNLKTPFQAIRQMMNRNYKTWIRTAESLVELNRREMGTVATFLDDVPLRVQKAWQNGIDKWIVKPFAESYLTFAMYGPMNIIEDVLRTSLGGVAPGRKTAQAFARKWAGTSFDPDLMRGSWSETMGEIRARPASEHNNWVLQMAFLGNKGLADRVYNLAVVKPGHVGVGMRRNFVDGYATQELKRIGGDQFTTLANVGPRNLDGITTPKVAKEVQQIATNLKIQGLPEAIRAAKGDFTHTKMKRREVDNILKEHPDLPRPVRDQLMEAYDDKTMFREVSTVKLAKEVELISVTTEIGQGYDLVFKGEKVGLITFGTTEGLGIEGIMIGSVDISPAARRQGIATTALGRILGDAEIAGKPLFSGLLEPDGVRWLEGLERKGLIRLEPHEQKMFGHTITRGEKQLPGDIPIRPGDSIDITIRDANTIMMDDFIASPERASEQFENLSRILTEMEVRNPQELSELIHSLNFMSSIYGATPKQIMGRATNRSRGLPFNERRVTMDKALDSITIFRERAGVSMDGLIDKIKTNMNTIYADNPIYKGKAETLFNLQTAKRLRGSELGEEISAWRHDFFADATPAELRTNDFWDGFDREILQRHHDSNVEMARYDGQIKNAIDDVDIAGGGRARQRPAIRVFDRELAPNDVAQLIGVRGDDVSRTIMDVAASQNDRDMFVEYVMAHVREGDSGFTRQSVGVVFDQISYSLHVDPRNISWMSARQIELDTVRRDLHNLHNSKMMPEEDVAKIGKYLDETADAVQAEMFDPAVTRQLISERDIGLAEKLATTTDIKGFEAEVERLVKTGVTESDARAMVIGKESPLVTIDRAKQDEIREIITKAAEEVRLTAGRSISEIKESVLQNEKLLRTIDATPDEIRTMSTDEFQTALRFAGERNAAPVRSLVNEIQKIIDGENVTLRNVVDDWFHSSDNEALQTMGRIGGQNKEYLAKIHGVLREQYPTGFIRIYRGAGAAGKRAGKGIEGGALEREFTNVTSSRKTALEFEDTWGSLSALEKEKWVVAGKPSIDDTLIRIKDVVAMGAVDESELIIRSSIISRNILKPLKPPTKTTPAVVKPEFKGYQDLRQQAMDTAHSWYYKEFTNYSNANMFDAMMKAIYPFWAYESQRWFWLPRSFIRHPGTFTSFERWQDNTDYGYIHIPGTSIDVNPFRGTIYGTLSTRLTRRDYPEYYDSLPVAGDIIEFSDFLSRYGFYPGAHIGIPMAVFGGTEMQFGEALPSIMKTPLDFLIGMFPDNESVKWISERVFGDRFRSYMTMLIVSRMGGDGSLIFTKQKEGVELTPDEELLWTNARREVGFYTAGFEQFGIFRMRTDEQYQMFKEASAVVEEMTGYTSDQQDWLRKHGYRIWDMVGGMSPTEQTVLQEMDYYRWVGNVRPLLPGRQQEILNKIELGWDRVANYGDDVQQQKLTIQRDFLSAARGPDNYNSMLLDIYDSQRKFIEAEIEQFPLMDINNRADYYKEFNVPQPVLHPFRELLNLYYSIELKEITDPETGEKVRDWDNFWAQRQAIEDAIPDENRNEWDDFLSRNSTRMEQVRRDVFRNYFRTYNKVWETILSSYPENEQALVEEYLHLERTGQQLARQEEIKGTISELTGKALISSFRSDVSGAKKALRFHNPQLDAWLFYWGRTSSFTAPTGEDAYKELARQTGRKI